MKIVKKKKKIKWKNIFLIFIVFSPQNDYITKLLIFQKCIAKFNVLF